MHYGYKGGNRTGIGAPSYFTAPLRVNTLYMSFVGAWVYDSALGFRFCRSRL